MKLCRFKIWKRSSSCHHLVNWRKSVSVIMMIALLTGMLWAANPNEASADCGSTGVPSDTLTIKVGYYGGPYYIKKVYTLTDFDQLPQVQQAYTFIDNMPAVCIDSAQGVKLADLLVDSGIDINSVQKFYFYATDIKQGWYQCLDKSYLFDTPRYYYPNLPSKWNYDTLSAPSEAVADAVQVEPIIAYRDNWQRYGDAPDFSAYDTSTRFRLLFGQSGTREHNASMSARWVHSIEVMLGGMPPSGIALDQNNINLKVGSTMQLTATVSPDDSTEKSVNWSSNNESAATVDKNGVVSVVGTGTAIITVSTVVGDIAATCVVNGPKENSDAGTVAVGSRGSSPKTGRTGNEEQRFVQVKSPSAQQGGSQPWRIYEMSADAVPLQKQKEQTIPVACVIPVFLVLFILGAVTRYGEIVGFHRNA